LINGSAGMRLDLSVSLELRYVCVQCGREMEIQGVKERNPAPLLKCPGCGFKVQIQQGPGLPGVQAPGPRFPPLKPKRV